jgi:hypothetical protein
MKSDRSPQRLIKLAADKHLSRQGWLPVNACTGRVATR